MSKNFNKLTFIEFVNSLPLSEGTTVILDNIPFHRSKETIEAFQAKGYKPLYTLPYSPKLNAIENVLMTLFMKQLLEMAHSSLVMIRT